MLDLFGSHYVIDHVIAEHNTQMKNEIYQGYVGDMLKVLAESWGATVNYRYIELIKKPKEEKTGDEIVIEIIQKAGLRLKNVST